MNKKAPTPNSNQLNEEDLGKTTFKSVSNLNEDGGKKHKICQVKYKPQYSENQFATDIKINESCFFKYPH